jgi:NTE family protein
MNKQDIPDKQRALVLQGSVALGAFEAGVFKKLYEMIKTKDPNWEKRMFDIVIGTSAGAINAAILISHYKQNRTWEGSAEKLLEYWKNHLSVPTPSITKNGVEWWNEYYELWGKFFDIDNKRNIALEESARRYYSTKYFFTYGVPSVFLPVYPFPQPDSKFLDNNPLFPPTNLWLRYSNKPLRDSLGHKDLNGKKFVKFPLTTSFDEPRLLAVSVDVQHGKAVTFDSYSKKSAFQSYDQDTRDYEDYIVQYENGIMVEHIMASASFPLFFDYEKVDGRNFWDGGILSNTPLRELLQAHRDYWFKEVKAEKVPDLEVYIINVWPSEEKTVPIDHDGVKDRKNDITHSDKTEYDQKIAALVTDYVNLFKMTKGIALNHIKSQAQQKLFENDLTEFLEKDAESRKRTGEQRKYKDLIDGRFDLKRVVTIERKDDLNSISNKWADYTSETINTLISEGENFERNALVKITPSGVKII